MARTNDGTSLVSGIQDISAFLPIIGTDQCERHVGEALEGGYLYAAAAPLSMFGSLGIVKASTAILVASFSPGSAQMLVNAGFKLEGSVAAMLGTAAAKRGALTSEDNGLEVSHAEYIAAQRFRALLTEQHIEKSQPKLVFNYTRWNWELCISTGLLACLSILPYISLIRDSNPPSRSFPAWAPPLMRIVGSAVSVIVAQMIIQGQIRWALESMLDGTDLRSPTSDVEKGNHSTNPDVETAIRPSSSTSISDSGTGNDSDSVASSGRLTGPNSSPGSVAQDEIIKDTFLAPPPPSPRGIASRAFFAGLQFMLFIGIGATAVGYLGCFTIVQNAPASSTYMWLGIEVALALLRIYIWGLNPRWDEATGLTLELQLPDDFEQAPRITTAQDLQKDILPSVYYKQTPFVILTDSEFLDYISLYTGPVQRFSDPDNHVAIYYTLAGVPERGESEEHKALLTTILDLESRTTFLLVNYYSPIDGGCGSYDPVIYSATSELLEDIGIMTAKCGIQLHPEHKFRSAKRFAAIAQHSQTIANRIGGMGRVTRLHVSWGLELSASELEKQKQLDTPTSPLTQFEKAYLEVHQLAYPWRRDFDRELDLRVIECLATILELESPGDKEDILHIAVTLENLMNYESAFFEKHLAARYPSSHIFHQWAQRLEVRQAGKARSEALTTRIAKYQGLGGAAENSFSELPKKVMVVTDIDDNSLKHLHRVEPRHWWPASVIALLELEQVQVDHRLSLWKDSASSSVYLAEAIFAAYPSAACSNDPELFEIMAARRCAVFDFDNEKTISAPAFDKLPNEHGVSLLRCPEQWIPQLTDLVHSNPRVLALQISDGVDDELQGAVERNRRDWGANTSNLSDGISRFYFADGFEAWEDSMLVRSREATSFLIIKTEQAGKWRVNFWHRQFIMNAGDLSVSLTLRTQVAADSTLLGTMEISHTEEFKRESLTVELPAGVHQINLRFFKKDDYGFMFLRKVWVTHIHPETDEDISAAGDKLVSNEEESEPAKVEEV
ncbi:hypothetical protein C8F04DRAFT_1274961 [Mycena alexandri]|uniref:Uncharacterized protein n=1 Tax=Mycena alexandri TaxID=1745969 RepID=A0AAD6WN14_9AGAR|nr:hypothetical protein C8F04DRAFT_1274961 [Mycena alexandri]